MIAFGEKLTPKLKKQCLPEASLLLAHCVRKSWEDTWSVALNVKVDLGVPTELPCTKESFMRIRNCQ